MARASRGVDLLLVVGLASLALGLLISFAAFQRMQAHMAEPMYVGAPGPSMGMGWIGGLLAVAGLAMLGWWSIGPQARYAARAAGPEIAAAIREANAALACPACGTANPGDAKHCKECGGRLIGTTR